MTSASWVTSIQMECNRLKNVELGKLWKSRRREVRDKWSDKKAEELWNYLADGEIELAREILKEEK